MPDSIEDIIARAYDAEEAAQMGEPSPWTATDAPDHAEFAAGRLACAEAVIAALEAAGFAICPKEATDGLLISMAIRHDHGFSAPHAMGEWGIRTGYTDDEREAVLRSMRQLHEEVVGIGFYSPEREDAYLAMLARPKP